MGKLEPGAGLKVAVYDSSCWDALQQYLVETKADMLGQDLEAAAATGGRRTAEAPTRRLQVEFSKTVVSIRPLARTMRSLSGRS